MLKSLFLSIATLILISFGFIVIYFNGLSLYYLEAQTAPIDYCKNYIEKDNATIKDVSFDNCIKENQIIVPFYR